MVAGAPQAVKPTRVVVQVGQRARVGRDHVRVTLNACENTMRNQKLARNDMHPNVTCVPAGVVQIIERQQAGWASLRP